MLSFYKILSDVSKARTQVYVVKHVFDCFTIKFVGNKPEPPKRKTFFVGDEFSIDHDKNLHEISQGTIAIIVYNGIKYGIPKTALARLKAISTKK